VKADLKSGSLHQDGKLKIKNEKLKIKNGICALSGNVL